MNKMVMIIALAALLALPAWATAESTETEKRAARQQCKEERGQTQAKRKAFKTKYHSFGRCVRQKVAEEEAEDEAARKNAATRCAAERGEIGTEAFEKRYGRNGNARDAFGRCVSTKAREERS